MLHGHSVKYKTKIVHYIHGDNFFFTATITCPLPNAQCQVIRTVRAPAAYLQKFCQCEYFSLVETPYARIAIKCVEPSSYIYLPGNDTGILGKMRVISAEKGPSQGPPGTPKKEEIYTHFLITRLHLQLVLHIAQLSQMKNKELYL